MRPPVGWMRAHLSELAPEVKGSLQPQRGRTYELWSVPAFAEGRPELIDGSEVASSKRPVQPDDVLLCKINPRINRVWRVTEDVEFGAQIASPEWIVLRPNDKHLLEPDYLRYYLSSPVFRDWIVGEVSSVTGSHTRAKPALVMRQEIPYPSRPEQRRIIAILEEHLTDLDAATSGLARVERRSATLIDSLLRRGFSGDLFADDLSEGSGADLVFRITGRPPTPDGRPGYPSWATAKLGDLFEVGVGTTPSRGSRELWSGDLPWVSSGEVAFNRIKATKETIRRAAAGSPTARIHPAGTVLLAMIGEGKTRGQAAILDIEAAHNQNCASIRVGRTPILPEYVYYFLKRRYVETRSAASGGNQPALNKARVQAIEMPVAPLATQRRLVTAFDSVTAASGRLLGATDRSRRNGESMRRSLLAAAFSGRLTGASSDADVITQVAQEESA